MKEAYENPAMEIVEIDGGVDVIFASGCVYAEADYQGG